MSLRTNWLEMLNISIFHITLKMNNLRQQPHIPRGSEIIHPSLDCDGLVNTSYNFMNVSLNEIIWIYDRIPLVYYSFMCEEWQIRIGSEKGIGERLTNGHPNCWSPSWLLICGSLGEEISLGFSCSRKSLSWLIEAEWCIYASVN